MWEVLNTGWLDSILPGEPTAVFPNRHSDGQAFTYDALEKGENGRAIINVASWSLFYFWVRYSPLGRWIDYILIFFLGFLEVS